MSGAEGEARKVRRVVAGVDADGRSAVSVDGEPAAVFRFAGGDAGVDPHDLQGASAGAELAPAEPGEVVVADIWRANPAQPPGVAEAEVDGFDVEVLPGAAAWRIVEMGARREAPIHATDTLDYDLVLAGEIELLLDDGPVLLHQGDAVVLQPGVAHGWRTGEGPCRMSVVQIGRSSADGGTPDRSGGESLE